MHNARSNGQKRRFGLALWPNMRELQLTDATDGIADVFDDISALASQCWFSDCTHGTEPGCAIKNAVKRGDITPDRLARWSKNVAEEWFNSASLAERRSDDKACTNDPSDPKEKQKVRQ